MTVLRRISLQLNLLALHNLRKIQRRGVSMFISISLAYFGLLAVCCLFVSILMGAAGLFVGPQLLGTALFFMALGTIAAAIYRGLAKGQTWALWSGRILLTVFLAMMVYWMAALLLQGIDLAEAGWAPWIVALVIPISFAPLLTVALIALFRHDTRAWLAARHRGACKVNK